MQAPQLKSAPTLLFEELTGLPVIDSGRDAALSRLQQEGTMQPQVNTGAAPVHRTGMRYPDTLEEIDLHAHQPGYRAVFVTDLRTGEIEGFQDFSVSPISATLYKEYLDNQSFFPEHLRGLAREEIGYAGAVVMEERLEHGQYRRTHAVMIKEEREAGKKLILDFCFEQNTDGLASHHKKGYEVLSKPDGTPIKVRAEFHTGPDDKKEFFLIWCDPNTALQDALIRDFEQGRKNGQFRFSDRSPYSG